MSTENTAKPSMTPPPLAAWPVAEDWRLDLDLTQEFLASPCGRAYTPAPTPIFSPTPELTISVASRRFFVPVPASQNPDRDALFQCIHGVLQQLGQHYVHAIFVQTHDVYDTDHATLRRCPVLNALVRSAKGSATTAEPPQNTKPTAEPNTDRAPDVAHAPTPGEVAYNAYCFCRDWKAVNGDPLPSFRELSRGKPDVARGWEVAAQAVINAAAIEHVVNDDSLPVVAGPFTETVENMTHRARVLLRDAMDSLAAPALVAFLCDAIRLWRSNTQEPFVYKPRWLFEAGERVKHVRTGGEYRITHGRGDSLFLEATGEPAYAYGGTGEDGVIRYWVRSARQMEDGRFTLIARNPA